MLTRCQNWAAPSHPGSGSSPESLRCASHLSCMRGDSSGHPKALPHFLHKPRKTKSEFSSPSIPVFCSWTLRFSPSYLMYPLPRILCFRQASLLSALQKCVSLSYRCPHSNGSFLRKTMYKFKGNFPESSLTTPVGKSISSFDICGSLVLTARFKEFRALLRWPGLRRAFPFKIAPQLFSVPLAYLIFLYCSYYGYLLICLLSIFPLKRKLQRGLCPFGSPCCFTETRIDSQHTFVG